MRFSIGMNTGRTLAEVGRQFLGRRANAFARSQRKPLARDRATPMQAG
jgi:hypothetical protein